MMKALYNIDKPNNMNEIPYHLNNYNIIVIEGKEEIVVFVKSKKPKVSYYHYNKTYELEWMYKSIEQYYVSLENELDQTEFIYGSIHGMIKRLGKVEVVYF